MSFTAIIGVGTSVSELVLVYMCFYPKNALFLFWWYEFDVFLGDEFPLSFVFVFQVRLSTGIGRIYGFTDGWIDGLTDCRMD